MRKVVVGLLGAAMVTSVGAMLPTVASAAPPADPQPAAKSGSSKAPIDDLPNPLEDKRRALRTQAVSDVVSGKSKPETRNGSKVVKVGKDRSKGKSKDQYVELSRERTDRIFVILAEFGNQRSPQYPDVDSDPDTPGPTTFDGPLHNAIPQPDRKKDNSTVWQADYNADHYRQLYFGTGKNTESLKTYMESQSSGRYTVNGEVTDWVKVPYNEARYGRDTCGSNVCSNTWALVRDAANQWVADQKAAGRTDAQVAEDMKSFDQYDRYDFDGDGNFNEPDGYIDHFQIVHAGGDQADGDPQQGEDAIWSHRWYAYPTDQGVTGPSGNLLGGTQIGNTGIWVGDYTIQPENGGLSVFTHEYTHDLGLPDDYDTTGLGDNSNEYWTLMAQSRLNAAGEALGTRPGDMGAWNKLQLGWLNYSTVKAGQKKVVNLGPEEFNTKKPQAVVVQLPDKTVTTSLGAPFAGTKQFFSGNADDLDNSLSHDIDLTGKTSASVTLKGRYNIEQDFDYLYFEASTDNGATWKRLDGTLNGAPMPKDASGASALTGSSGGNWADVAIPLNAYAGQKIAFRLHYLTDGGVSEGGFFGDELTITADGATVLADGAEGTSTWVAKGFSIVGANVTKDYPNYYIAGNRSYTSYDKYLETGPYNFGWATTKPDFVEHYNYQTGLLISYWDTSQADNNTNVHPGSGRNLYVDAHPKPFKDGNGVPFRARIQVYDAPFGLKLTDGMLLHVNGKASPVWPQLPNPVFNDKAKYFYDELPNQGVKLPAVGVKIGVLSQNGTSMTVAVS
ncbi:M6 family metalloprotease domain-containing protein [Actinoplanes sp. TBRC 11911]|uniref:immune inhibitor A domain-containing protein n=1 Tax=Actinoplanes sp. TBRC 11911 TaxID=2729386 RepID=UPI00145CA91D|nr:immune inhibitor A domain-containing protein [Actinoplanes sp. TBRC 11911]NMO54395.1 M6 family metalloprotease domain-containing protein [Actinoplanes sp. TBRC 11911]